MVDAMKMIDDEKTRESTNRETKAWLLLQCIDKKEEKNKHTQSTMLH